MINQLKALKQKHLQAQYDLIESNILPLLLDAITKLAIKLPTKKIQLSCGGMGSSLSLWIHNKDHKQVALPVEFLSNSLVAYYDRYLPLFSELIALQVQFEELLTMGYFPDFGNITYNPITYTIEHNDNIKYL